jgi:hypothetical protein
VFDVVVDFVFDFVFDPVFDSVLEVGVIPNEVPRFFFTATFWRARDADKDLLSAKQPRL